MTSITNMALSLPHCGEQTDDAVAENLAPLDELVVGIVGPGPSDSVLTVRAEGVHKPAR